jgi:hypothetical protein
MTLKEIVTKLGELETGFKSLFTAKEDNAEVVALRDQLAGIQSTVAGQLTELTSLNATLKTEVETLSAAATAITTSLDGAIASLKLEAKTDATAAEKIEVLKAGVTSTLAKFAVKAEEIPVTGSGSADSAKIAADYNAITDPKERVVFYRKNKAAIDQSFKS